MVDIGFIEKSLKTPSIKIGHPKNSIAEGFSIDSRDISPNQCFIAVIGEIHNGHNYIRECNSKGVRFFIIQNDYKNRIKKYIHNSFIIPVKDTLESLSILAKSYKKHIFASSIGITGSSGKTTTRDLIARVLSAKYNVHASSKNYNNNIGLPLTILQAPLQTHILVLEMGMNHKGELKKLSQIAEPLLGLITNVGYAHIGMFGSLEKIAEAKSEIFSGINSHGIILLNRDDNFLEYFKKISPVETMDFGISDLSIIEDRGLEGYRLSYKNNYFEYHCPGSHNLSNLAAAIKVSEIYQVDEKETVRLISDFKPLHGRSEIIPGNFTIIQDTYNANPSSMLKALELLGKAKGRRIAVLSDMLELGHLSHELHCMIGRHISKNKNADIVLAFGNNSRNIIENIKEKGIEKKFFQNQEELSARLAELVRSGDTVLVKASHEMKLENTAAELLKIQTAV